MANQPFYKQKMFHMLLYIIAGSVALVLFSIAMGWHELPPIKLW
jgi:hypothetical protein